MASDLEPIQAPDETTENEQISRIKRYDQRVEEWLSSLKDEAGQRSPEVLTALAAKAQDVADYLNKTAEKAKARNVTSSVASSAESATSED
jgi:hypothetical protein